MPSSSCSDVFLDAMKSAVYAVFIMVGNLMWMATVPICPNEPDESNFKHKINIKAYPTQERGGLIWAYVGSGSKLPELPDLEWACVPDSHRYNLNNEQSDNGLPMWRPE